MRTCLMCFGEAMPRGLYCLVCSRKRAASAGRIQAAEETSPELRAACRKLGGLIDDEPGFDTETSYPIRGGDGVWRQ